METTFVPAAQLDVREAGGGVHELSGVCVPYGVVTRNAGPTPELFRPGAFAGALAASSKVRLIDNNHAGDRRPVGVAVELREDDAGLFGRFRFYDTPEGRAAFENVREDTYGGLSIGFVPVRETRNADGVREVTEARLHHVSLVDEPAYDDALIVAVRRRDVDRWGIFRRPPVVELPDDADVPLIVAIGRVPAV
jgi:HK97 family phage prohead protease